MPPRPRPPPGPPRPPWPTPPPSPVNANSIADVFHTQSFDDLFKRPALGLSTFPWTYLTNSPILSVSSGIANGTRPTSTLATSLIPVLNIMHSWILSVSALLMAQRRDTDGIRSYARCVRPGFRVLWDLDSRTGSQRGEVGEKVNLLLA